MANFSHLFPFVVLLLVPEVLAITNHIVGDESGWNTGVDYSSWTIGKTFFVGDNLVFKYEKKMHNVIEVNVSTFAQCSTPTDQQPLDTGNDAVPLLLPGIHWFICTVGHHCNSGQKLIISVDTPPTPPVIPQAPPPPTPPVIPQAPPPPTPSVIPQPSSPPTPSVIPQPSSPPTPSVIPQPSPPPLPSFPPIAFPPLLLPIPIPLIPPAPSPSVLPPIILPPPNKTSPQPSSRPVPVPAPAPTENIPPSQSHVPTPSAPSPSRAAAKSPLSVHIFGFLAVAVGAVAGIMI